jgi:DNA-binding response OmpR family regulator
MTDLERRILVVDDEPSIGALVCAVLRRDGLPAVHVLGVDAAQIELRRGGIRGIVLDLGLGERSGLDLLRESRATGLIVPVLVLTSDSAEATIVRALDAGAADYVVKPVRPLEFSARVRALLRRPTGETVHEISIGALCLRRLDREISVAGQSLTLSPKEYALLEYLMLQNGMVTTRTELLARVWNMHFDPGSNVVDVHVARLRRKLDQAGARVRIEARRGQGFVLMPADANTWQLSS